MNPHQRSTHITDTDWRQLTANRDLFNINFQKEKSYAKFSISVKILLWVAKRTDSR